MFLSKLLSALSIAATASAAFQCQAADDVGADETLYLGAAIDQPISFQFNRKDATYIAPHFAWINIPPGGSLTIRSPDGSQQRDYSNVNQTNFYAEYIQGDTALLTYTPPAVTDGTTT
ncbi:hypothetical protein As57867_003071, partial [Aphanomyces stellatus]